MCWGFTAPAMASSFIVQSLRSYLLVKIPNAIRSVTGSNVVARDEGVFPNVIFFFWTTVSFVVHLAPHCVQARRRVICPALWAVDRTFPAFAWQWGQFILCSLRVAFGRPPIGFFQDGLHFNGLNAKVASHSSHSARFRSSSSRQYFRNHRWMNSDRCGNFRLAKNSLFHQLCQCHLCQLLVYRTVKRVARGCKECQDFSLHFLTVSFIFMQRY